MTDTNLCPCDSQRSLENCCLPIIQGKKTAQTAEELLRARYTAFTRGDVDFIISTHHSRTRHEVKKEEIEDWSKNSEWLGLKIAQVEAGASKDPKGTIIFSAQFRTGEKIEDHVEKSVFEKENGEWKFVDGFGIHQGTYQRTQPKTSRNEPCPCGSGKKYKKCCAQTASLN
jgi:SEC-C motif-containing protein